MIFDAKTESGLVVAFKFFETIRSSGYVTK
jgi:hypothetical protein